MSYSLYDIVIVNYSCKIAHVLISHSDLMEELLPYIRESIDRKQENMRRRKRRDALRVTLVKLFEMSAEQGTFALRYACLVPK